MAHTEINMQSFARSYETYIVDPLANGISQTVPQKQRAQLCDILKYDIKAMTFNIATIIGVAYVVLTLFRSIGLFHGVVGAGVSFFIREVANESLAVTKAKSLTQLFSRALDYLDNFTRDNNWKPDYLSWNKICILKNPSLPLNRQFQLVKRLIFAKT